MLGNGGFFNNRIKYLKTRRDDLDTPDIDQVSAQLNNIQVSPEEDLLFLKTCVVKNTDSAVIVAKLKSTQKLRQAMLRDANIDLRASFPFFISNPDLVNCIILLTFNSIQTNSFNLKTRLRWISLAIQISIVMKMHSLISGQITHQNYGIWLM